VRFVAWPTLLGFFAILINAIKRLKLLQLCNSGRGEGQKNQGSTRKRILKQTGMTRIDRSLGVVPFFVTSKAKVGWCQLVFWPLSGACILYGAFGDDDVSLLL
jgi:hypothetical protein